MHSPKAIIIGSGVAGMAIAIRLAAKGFVVHVFEKNAYPGGKVSSFERHNYRFDEGPSLFTWPQNIEELFELADEPIAEYFTYEPVGIACKYFYENGKVINGFTDGELFADELAEKTGESKETVTKYLQRSKRLFEHVGGVFLNHSLHKRKTWLNIRVLKALSYARPGYLFKTLNRYNSTYFSSSEAMQLFNRYATYNGSDPYKAPAMLSLIPHLEHNEGTFYPTGGMVSISNALYNLALKKGVKFSFNAPVDRIIYTEGKANGVVVNGENMLADAVVSNSDIYFTYKKLLRNALPVKKILKRERSSSALVFYWGIGKSFPALQLHNIFFSADYKEEFNSLFNKKTVYTDPTVYVNITSKMEAGHAPPGKENWFVMINVPPDSGQDWEKIKQQVRGYAIKKLERILQTPIESLIETEAQLDPVMIEERTGSFMGALYGSSSNSKLAAFLRPANFNRNLKGLYFCGGSVHPGGGIPLCLKSAAITAGIIENDLKKHRH